MAGLFSQLIHPPKRKGIVCSAVVVAAGSSSRMDGLDKMMMTLCGEPLLVHTLRALAGHAMIQEIILVTREDLIIEAGRICKDYSFDKVTKIIVGGNTRMKSVFAGISEVSKNAELIAIHDGARPFAESEILDEVIARAAECGAAAPAIPVKDTIKRALDGLVTETLDRNGLYSVQTPQVFEATLIKAALLKALKEKIVLTDDCSAVERLGMTVALTRGNDENIKITTPSDLLLGEMILERRLSR